MEVTFISLSLLGALVLCICRFLSKHNNFFKERGVEFEKPTIFFGNMFGCFMGWESEASVFDGLYEKFSREK